MVNIKANILFSLSVVFLIITLSAGLLNSHKIFNLKDLKGEWFGVYEYNAIKFVIKKNSCSIEYKSKSSLKLKKIIGKCLIDNSKTPYTLIVKDIVDFNSSLYALINPINKNGIFISKFSNKWKMRPVIFNNSDAIFLEKYVN